MHHPRINEAVAIVKRWIEAEEIEPYQENGGTGVLRYLQFNVERSTNKIQIVLVITKEISKSSLKKLWDSIPFVHSLWVNWNQRRDNVIFGKDWERCFGEEWLWETLAGG